MKIRRTGFTLIELMVVVSIIIILASIAVPYFFKYRETSLRAKCIANLRCIQDAREAFFIEHPAATEIASANQIAPYLGYSTGTSTSGGREWKVSKSLLECPAGGGSYTLTVNLTNIDTMPTCAYTGGGEAHIYVPDGAGTATSTTP